MDELLFTFDVDAIAPEALLFQTGYLTIHHTEPRGGRMFYRLGYPNREVRQNLHCMLDKKGSGNAICYSGVNSLDGSGNAVL